MIYLLCCLIILLIVLSIMLTMTLHQLLFTNKEFTSLGRFEFLMVMWIITLLSMSMTILYITWSTRIN